MPVLYLSVVVDLIGIGIIVPLLPFYAQAFGASPLTVSLLYAVFSLTQFLSAPLLGRLSDRIGRRPVFLGCVMLSCLAYFSMAFADSLLPIFIARAINGVGAGKIAVANAIVADITPPETRAKRLGLLSSAFGIGMILGPVLGGLLSGDPANPDFHSPMFAAAGLSAIAAVLGFLLVKESLPASARHPRGGGAGFVAHARATLGDGRLLPLIGFLFAFNFVFAQVVAINPLWLQASFGYGPRETGAVFGFIGLVLLVVQAAGIGPAVRLFGERRVLLGGVALMAFAMLATPLAINTPLYLLFGGLTAAAIGLIGPSSYALLSRAAGPERQGAVMGAAQGIGSLAQVIGPGVAGWLFGALGYNAPYLAGGALLALACIVAGARLPK